MRGAKMESMVNDKELSRFINVYDTSNVSLITLIVSVCYWIRKGISFCE